MVPVSVSSSSREIRAWSTQSLPGRKPARSPFPDHDSEQYWHRTGQFLQGLSRTGSFSWRAHNRYHADLWPTGSHTDQIDRQPLRRGMFSAGMKGKASCISASGTLKKYRIWIRKQPQNRGKTDENTLLFSYLTNQLTGNEP